MDVKVIGDPDVMAPEMACVSVTLVSATKEATKVLSGIFAPRTASPLETPVVLVNGKTVPEPVSALVSCVTPSGAADM